MSFWNKVKGQFVDVIEWLDDSNDTIVYRFERQGNEIKYGAQLTVRESQTAVFINEGQLADIFSPGRYQLTTQNMPILTTIKSWKHGFNSPFKAEVYFINTRIFYDNKWGTPNPVRVRDPELGSMGVNIRAFGSYSFRITEPAKFLMDVVGTDGHFTTDEISSKLRSLVIKQFTTALGSSQIPFLDLAANYELLSEEVKKRLLLDFDRYGVNITDFIVENVSVPENVQKILDQRNEMEIMGRDMAGNLDNYQKFKMGSAMEKAAESGGTASDAMSAGLGFAMANQFSQQQQQQPQQQQQFHQHQHQQSAPPPPPPMLQFHTYINGQQQGPFDMNALRQMAQSGQLTKDVLVWKDGMAGWTAAGQVPELTPVFGATPPPPPPPPPPGS
ncbi:MAG: SPFH domain-containing protein [Bernardetiaceae bacterium]|nr:SPFH domain-containing protein [Bernardetiaceae bacterium]